MVRAVFCFWGVQKVMIIAKQASAADRRLARERGREWKQFRRDFLYSQQHLAHALGCALRTVSAIESGCEVYAPHYGLLRRFRDLKEKMERAHGPRPVQPDHTPTYAAQRGA